MDTDPRANRVAKKLLRIDEDYYVAVPPDPTDEEKKGMRATLRALIEDTPHIWRGQIMAWNRPRERRQCRVYRLWS
jgi:hypothetical protein